MRTSSNHDSAEKLRDYHTRIAVPLAPDEVVDKIARVSEWWTKGIEGKSRKLGDAFTVRFGETFVDLKVSELIPDRKIVWKVIDCNLHWIENKTEWKGTEIVFEVASDHGMSSVVMTHRGLVPDVECYENCEAGWSFYVGKSLHKFLTDGKGLPDGQGKNVARR